jgi:hypothetical protein
VDCKDQESLRNLIKINDKALKRLKEMEWKIDHPVCKLVYKKIIYKEKDNRWQQKVSNCKEIAGLVCLNEDIW